MVLTGSRILVVDDELTFAENLREYFSRRLAEVLVLESGEAAVDGAGRFRPEIVIIADRLPGMDGAHTCEVLKRQTDSPFCILLTDRTGVLSRADFRAGVDRILEKPFPLAELERIVRPNCSPLNRDAGTAATDASSIRPEAMRRPALPVWQLRG